MLDNETFEKIKKDINKYLVQEHRKRKDNLMISVFDEIINILNKYLPKTKETTFIFEDREYNAVNLIYALSNNGIIDLNHDEMEEVGVKVIL